MREAKGAEDDMGERVIVTATRYEVRGASGAWWAIYVGGHWAVSPHDDGFDHYGPFVKADAIAEAARRAQGKDRS